MKAFKKFFLKVKKFFSNFTKRKNDDPVSSQGAVLPVPDNDGPLSSQSAESPHMDELHISQRTIPTHSHDQSSDTALSRIISIVEVAEKVVDDISVPGLKSVVKVLLYALKKIKVCSQYVCFNSYIMCQMCDRQPGIMSRHSSSSETVSTNCTNTF